MKKLAAGRRRQRRRHSDRLCFHPRCRYCQQRCKQEVPQWEEVSTDHYVACHRAKELSLGGVEADKE